MTRNIDELSNLQTKSEPPEQYFKKMDLDEEQVERRIEYTEKANELFDVILVLLLTMQENGSVDYGYARGLLESWLLSLIAEFTTPDDYLIDYATDTAYNFIDASERHEGDPWYTSADRSLYNAENSANDVLNYDEYRRAIEAGKTHKKWITENDKKVRDSHRELHNKVIPIKEYFRVGIARMRFPKDYEYAGMFPEELVNCRCSIEYLPKTKDELKKEQQDETERKIGNYSSSGNTLNWDGEYRQMTKDEFLQLRDFADEKGISLRGVKNSYLDPQLVKDAIESTSKLLDKYGIRKHLKNQFTLDFSHALSDNDFAVSYPETNHIIYFNKNAYRNKELLEKNYNSLVEEGFFVKNSTYKDVPTHEIGHILGDIFGIDSIEVAKSVSGISKTNDLLGFLSDSLSTYAGLYNDGREIISESLVAVESGLDNKFAMEFIKECGII